MNDIPGTEPRPGSPHTLNANSIISCFCFFQNKSKNLELRKRNKHLEIYARLSPLVSSHFSLDFSISFGCIFSYKLPQILFFCNGRERRKEKQKEKSLKHS